MQEFYIPLYRLQFLSLFNCGTTPVPVTNLIEINAQDELNSPDLLLNALVEGFINTQPAFKWEEDFLILRVLISKPKSDILYLNTEDVKAVHTLSHQAKRSIESKNDTRINFLPPPFPDFLDKILDLQRQKSIASAIRVVWGLYELNSNPSALLDEIGAENLNRGITYRLNGKKHLDLQNENFWTLAISYDRYSNYSDNPIGYFFDFFEIFMFSKGANESEIRRTKFFGFLKNLQETKPDIKSQDIVKAIQENVVNTNLLNDIKLISSDLNPLVVIPFFLTIKESIRKTNNISDIPLLQPENILRYKTAFEKDFEAAILLNAVFYGVEKFNNIYYDNIPLRFFKTKEQILKEQEENERQKEILIRMQEKEKALERNKPYKPNYQYPVSNEKKKSKKSSSTSLNNPENLSSAPKNDITEHKTFPSKINNVEEPLYKPIAATPHTDTNSVSTSDFEEENLFADLLKDFLIQRKGEATAEDLVRKFNSKFKNVQDVIIYCKSNPWIKTRKTKPVKYSVIGYDMNGIQLTPKSSKSKKEGDELGLEFQ